MTAGMETLSESAGLYEGERLETISNAPTLTYFARGTDSGKPLVVFIPGAYHFARIAYGGHQGYRPSDFLAYWIQKSGYSFLAISYPLDSTPEVMPAICPDFTVSQWGAQAAEATRKMIEEMRLSNKNIVLLFWSMAGKVLQPYSVEARNLGLNVTLAVSLVATPALRGLREGVPNMTASVNGYASSQVSYRYFLAQLHEQNSINGGREIISDETYGRQYIGSFPVGIGAFGLRWVKEEAKFIEDKHVGFEVADDFNMADLPFLGAITGDSPLDFRHSVADKTTWSFLMTYQLIGAVNNAIVSKISSDNVATADAHVEELRRMVAYKQRAWMADNTDKTTEIMSIIRETIAKMCRVVHGNHHFFIGEQGAQETAEVIMHLQQQVEIFATKISTVLG